MQIRKPDYFDKFRCVAGDCPDSCCKEWDVQVDGASAENYRGLPGSLGDKLREALYWEEGDAFLALQDGRCPMWRCDGLCRIQAELGEKALCKTCREFPRLTHDYGGFVELGLELSCPEAAKWILNAPPEPLLTEDRPGGAPPEYDMDAMEVLLAARETMLAILSDPTCSVGEALALGLLYGCQVQGELDGGEPKAFDAAAALAEAKRLASPGDAREMLDFFRGLEILTPDWEARLRSPAPGPWEKGHRAMARYLTQRYWLQAVSDYDLYSRVKFIVTACLLVRELGGELLRTAQLFSKEIENDAQNVEAILDAAYTNPDFADDRLLGMLLK